ncbi:MAG: ectoine/hydroxyectoine ABC transporter substrate-binding protein EhuB [Nitriliruptorales bacterium]|nr:ectoine/hydroxyectoine ABC transporter substrate-binding protein EhuB [Nitriliruptorales bacterium]
MRTLARSRLLRLVAMVAGLALLAAACGGDDGNGGDGGDGEASGLLAELREEGSITIGIANEVPYGYIDDDGEPAGAAPDVAKAVLEELGIEEVNAEVVEFGQLIGGLQAGQFDMIAAGMYINQERAEQILFSDPDYCITESFAVEEGNPHDLSDYQSVAENPDVTLAVATGTVEVGYAEDAGIPDDQLEVFADIEGMYNALEAGEVDAVTGTTPTVNQQVEAREGIEAVPGFFPKDADGNEILPCGGYGFRLENQEFRDAFNEVLNEMQESGETVEIITQYDAFSEEDVRKANELTVEDFLE